ESVEEGARAMGPSEAWPAVFAEGSRSFSFAARLFPAEARSRITGIYAFCRFTDDLVDEASGEDLLALDGALDHWATLCKRAHRGDRTGIPLVDSVVCGMAERGVPLEYALELIEGVRMDVRPPVYASLDQLRLYTYRVASVVGGWMVRSFGIDDPWILDRAFALGHAMQLTNILRDVGEDLGRGRVYLPAELLHRHGLRVTDLEAMRADGWIDSAYPGVLEELMTMADESYAAAFEGLTSVPRFFARPVAAAASIYRGIHDGIRANGYDNLTLRAHTGTRRKTQLAVEGLMRLRRSRRAQAGLDLMVRGLPEIR
ncbi:MAG: phytoene/squalene synthase family protein, partial [Gemmatimonadota bacterium]|nr:phytoene/squalene synthase family protein [Gemmatimonadota bacterium]